MPKINFREDALYDVFIHQLVVDKGLDAEDRAQSGKISYELKLKLDEQLQKAMINALPDSKLEALGKLMDQEVGDDEIEKFFEGVAIDYPSVIQAEMVKFREEYLGKTQSSEKLQSVQGVESEPAPLQVQAHGGVKVASGQAPIQNQTSVQENQTQAVIPPTGNPVQGTTSETPGASDVNGNEQKTTLMTEGKQ